MDEILYKNVFYWTNNCSPVHTMYLFIYCFVNVLGVPFVRKNIVILIIIH